MDTPNKQKEHIVGVFEYNYIDDGIYIGTNLCCQTHFDEQLLKEGVTADISLEGEKVDAPFGVDFFTWIPVINHTAPTEEKIKLFVATLGELVNLNKKVYIHCQNGHGRAPTMTAAYFMKAKGMSAEKAIDFIRSRRPSIHLDEVQEHALKDWERHLGHA